MVEGKFRGLGSRVKDLRLCGLGRKRGGGLCRGSWIFC